MFKRKLLNLLNKDRVNQVVGGERVFAHQAAGEIVTAQAAWAGGGEGGCDHLEIVPQACPRLLG